MLKRAVSGEVTSPSRAGRLWRRRIAGHQGGFLQRRESWPWMFINAKNANETLPS
jgi:hypothetical protein